MAWPPITCPAPRFSAVRWHTTSTSDGSARTLTSRPPTTVGAPRRRATGARSRDGHVERIRCQSRVDDVARGWAAPLWGPARSPGTSEHTGPWGRRAMNGWRWTLPVPPGDSALIGSWAVAGGGLPGAGADGRRRWSIQRLRGDPDPSVRWLVMLGCLHRVGAVGRRVVSKERLGAMAPALAGSREQASHEQRPSWQLRAAAHPRRDRCCRERHGPVCPATQAPAQTCR